MEQTVPEIPEPLVTQIDLGDPLEYVLDQMQATPNLLGLLRSQGCDGVAKLLPANRPVA